MKYTKVLHWLDTGIFPGTILFACGFSYEKLIKLLKKKKAKGWLHAISCDKELIKSSHGLALKRKVRNNKTGKEVTYLLIIIKDVFKFTDYEYCKLAHEVLHLCQFYLPDFLDRNQEREAEAYLHTYIMQQCLKSLRGK